MLSVPGSTRLFLCREAVDFRKAHDGLCRIVRDEFDEDPFTGDVFVFFNKARDRIKLLFWDRNGFWLLYKRLERGTFPFDVRGEGARVEITRVQLSMMLEGIDGKSARISSHFSTTVAIRSRGGGDESGARPTP
ncbi:MAG: IS66 family insertion sequence element accessory protein TnpB [Planctomycetota bacterium]